MFLLFLTLRQEARARDEEKLVSFFRNKNGFLPSQSFSAPTQCHSSSEAANEDVDAAGELTGNSNKWNAFQVHGLTFSVIYFIYLFSCAASVMVINKGSGQL